MTASRPGVARPIGGTPHGQSPGTPGTTLQFRALSGAYAGIHQRGSVHAKNARWLPA